MNGHTSQTGEGKAIARAFPQADAVSPVASDAIPCASPAPRPAAVEAGRGTPLIGLAAGDIFDAISREFGGKP